MRESMTGLVPEDLRLRETKGGWHWFVAQTLALAGGVDRLRDLADTRMLADLGMVSRRVFWRLFENDCRHPDTADYETMWRVLAAEAFLRTYSGEPVGTSS